MIGIQDTLRHCGRCMGMHLLLVWVRLQTLSLVILEPKVQLSISENNFILI